MVAMCHKSSTLELCRLMAKRVQTRLNQTDSGGSVCVSRGGIERDAVVQAEQMCVGIHGLIFGLGTEIYKIYK